MLARRRSCLASGWYNAPSSSIPSAVLIVTNSSDIACLRCALCLAFIDVPENQRLRLQNAARVLAPQESLLQLAERHVRHPLPQPAMHGFDERLLLLRIGLANIFLAQS